VPLTRIGTATLVATGLTSGVTVTAYVEVVAPPAPHDGSGGGSREPADDNQALPTTGQSGARLLAIVSGGVAAVLVGGVLIGLARRRRDHSK
jgi:LPXTG-motif cell wall-anchored protein